MPAWTSPIKVQCGALRDSSLAPAWSLEALAATLPPTRESPHIVAMAAPRKSPPALKSKASRPDLQPLDEHLAELLNPAWPSRAGRIRRSAATQIRDPRAGKPPARPDRSGGLGRFAQGALGGGRSQHPQPAAMGSPPPAAAGQVGGRAALSRGVGIRAEGRPAAGDRGTGQGRALDTSATRCCSASPAPARPSPWRK